MPPLMLRLMADLHSSNMPLYALAGLIKSKYHQNNQKYTPGAVRNVLNTFHALYLQGLCPKRSSNARRLCALV